MMGDSQNRIYSNNGNRPLIELLSPGRRRVLDVGCGAGDNAFLIKTTHPDCEVFGITHSTAEADLAKKVMTECWILDIEQPLPAHIRLQKFDVLIFSHVLEHLRDPACVLKRFVTLLDHQGEVLIAVPNILSWRMRAKFLRGDFEYSRHGVLDDTHLRFFTYFTTDRYLLAHSKNLYLVCKRATGSAPLWFLRRQILPSRMCTWIDQWVSRTWPNLFGDQVLLRALKR
jgi:2-polyprenyl-3-methyl-5-hydroxy-6-metoxy-1,4-benzoquinol methylase